MLNKTLKKNIDTQIQIQKFKKWYVYVGLVCTVLWPLDNWTLSMYKYHSHWSFLVYLLYVCRMAIFAQYMRTCMQICIFISQWCYFIETFLNNIILLPYSLHDKMFTNWWKETTTIITYGGMLSVTVISKACLV